MAGFPETRWSLVLRAGNPDPSVARMALNELLTMYTEAVDRFLLGVGVRRQDVPDVRQEFFLDLIAHGAVNRVDSSKAKRFRWFVTGALRNHLGHVRERDTALKRAAGQSAVSLDVLDEGVPTCRHNELISTSDPEREFRLALVAALVRRVLDRITEECDRLGRSRDLEVYQAFLTSDEEPDHTQLALLLGITTMASRTRLKRLRQRFHELVRQCVAETLDDPADVEDELRCLLS